MERLIHLEKLLQEEKMERSLHKITIEVHEREWLKFKALAHGRGESIQRLVGELVEKEARAGERREAQRLGRTAAAKRAEAKLLAEIEGNADKVDRRRSAR